MHLLPHLHWHLADFLGLLVLCGLPVVLFVRRSHGRGRWWLILIASVGIPRPLPALTPPWDEAELRRAADLIVEGEIGEGVLCLGLVEKTRTVKIYQYVAPLTIHKILKGKAPGQRVELHFYHYDYTKGAVGDADAIHLPGEVGTYYLQRLNNQAHGAGEGEAPPALPAEGATRAPGINAWHQVHWSGVQVRQEGAGRLPACR